MILKDFEVVFCNAAACEICGYSAKELHSISPEQIKAMVHPGDQGMVWNRYLARLEGKPVPSHYAYRIIRKDGTIRWLEMHSRRIEYDGGPATQLALLDVTDRKQADEALRESEEKYRTLFEESTDGVFISTPDSKFADINPAGVEIFGYSSKEELLEADIAHDLYIDPNKREEIKAVLAEKGFVKDYEIHYKRKDGTEATVLETVNAVYNDAGDVVAYRGIMRDVTKQKRLEQQLLQAQKMESIGTLAGGIAHDFNNLLGGILGFASLIKANTPENRRIFDYANTIETSATRAAELTSQLLGFARGGRFEAKPANLNKIVDETLEIVGRTFDKSMEIDTNLFSKLPTVEANAGQLQQVLLNLCVNAHDAMDGMGKLIITTSTELLTNTYVEANIQAKPGLYVVLAVSDTGVGINKETIPRVFEPFFTTKKEGKGTGLGLSMVYGVVKNHGGFVNVYSELCVGSTFKVYLPASGKPELMETLETGPAKGGEELILVVDDEDSIRSLAEEMLESGGYKVLLAENGLEAAEIYEKRGKEIGLVILDMVMPKMGGREAFLKLKAMDPEVKALLSTGYSQDGKTQTILDSGVKGFLQKPYRLNALLSKVRSVLDMKN
jgi:PAS domain S-box-containing protein